MYSFWDHLDVLRSALLRAAVVTVVFAVGAFVMKDWLFAVVLAPRSSDFITYRLMETEPFFLHLMNTGLTEQFMVHVHTALYAGLLLASPYIIYEVFNFISPALYRQERRYAVWIVGAALVSVRAAYNHTLLPRGIIFRTSLFRTYMVRLSFIAD